MRVKVVYQIDRVISSWIEKIPAKARRPLARLSSATHPVVWGIVLAVGALISWGADSTALALACAVTALLLPIEQVLKQLFRRTRPETMYVDNMKFRSYSFPSGHAYAAVLVLGLFVAIVYSLVDIWLAHVLAGIGLGTAIAIGISRVYLGAHFPTDVIAGWLIGAIVVGCLMMSHLYAFGMS